MQWNPRYLALAADVLGAYAVAQQAPAPLKAQPAKPAKAAAPAGPKILAGAEELELLRNPKALGPKAAPLSAAELRAALSARREPVHAAVGLERRAGMAAAAGAVGPVQGAQGMGGVFVHPRPGLMTKYLGAEWFRLWKLSAEEGKRIGVFGIGLAAYSPSAHIRVAGLRCHSPVLIETRLDALILLAGVSGDDPSEGMAERTDTRQV